MIQKSIENGIVKNGLLLNLKRKYTKSIERLIFFNRGCFGLVYREIFGTAPGDATTSADAIAHLGVKHQQWQHLTAVAGKCHSDHWLDGSAVWQSCIKARQALTWQHSVQGAIGGEGRMLRLALEGLTTAGIRESSYAPWSSNMPYLVHVLFKQYYLSNVDAQNQSLFKQCNLSNVKNSKSGNISKSGNEVLKNFEFDKIIFDTKNYQSW